MVDVTIGVRSAGDEDNPFNASELGEASEAGSPLFSFSAPEPHHTKRCHPCPYYEGQIHHLCLEKSLQKEEKRCLGFSASQRECKNFNERNFFSGSLWERYDNGEWHRQRGDIRTRLDFIFIYRWDAGPACRTFQLSNGAMIRITRNFLLGGAAEFDFFQGPQPGWVTRSDWTNPPGDEFIEDLPEDAHSIRVRRSGDSEFGDPDDSLINMDALMSPRWQTGTLFKIYYGSGSDCIKVRLDRAGEEPWERLVKITTESSKINPNKQGPGEQAQEAGVPLSQPDTHIRDYDAPDFAAGDQAAMEAYPGYDKLKAFHERMKRKKEEQRQREEEARNQQSQQNQAGSKGAAPKPAGPKPADPKTNPGNQGQAPAGEAPIPQTPLNPSAQLAENLANLENIRAGPSTPVQDPVSTPTPASVHTTSPVRQPPQKKADGKGDKSKPVAEPKGKAVEKGNPTPEKRITRAEQKRMDEEVAKQKENDDNKGKIKAVNSKAGGKGKNKRPVEDESDAEDGDDEGNAMSPAPKKGKKNNGGRKAAQLPVKKAHKKK